MTIRTELLVASIGLLTAFAAGRYSVSAPEVKTDQTSSSVDNKQTDKNSHVQTIIVTIKDPSGAEKTTTTITKDTTTQVKDKDVLNTTFAQDVIPPKRNTLNVYALAGVDVKTPGVVYGVSVTKQVLGPISVGAWGLTSGIVGVSLGLSF